MSIYRGRTRKEFYLAALLYDSIEDRDFSSVKSLLWDKKADPNIVLPKKGISPFHLIIGSSSYDFTLEVTILILQNGGNPNVRSDEGLTPVHIAAAWGRLELLQLLLKCGGDPEVRDINYKTPLYYAHEENFVECLELLRSYVPIKNDLIRKEEEDCKAYSVKLDKILINNGRTIGEYEIINENHNDSIIKKDDNLQLLPESDTTEYVINWFNKHVEDVNDTSLYPDKLPKSTGSTTDGLDSFESSPDESDDVQTPVNPDKIVFRKVYTKTRKVSKNNTPTTSSNKTQMNRQLDLSFSNSTLGGNKTFHSFYLDAEDSKILLNETSYADAEEFTKLKEFSKESGIATLADSAIKDVTSDLADHYGDDNVTALNKQEKSSDYMTCSLNSVHPFDKNVFELTDDLTSLDISAAKSVSFGIVEPKIEKNEEVGSTDVSFVSVSEVYKYVDQDEGIVLYERRFLKSPSEYAGSVKSSSFSSKLSSLPETIDYDTDTLRRELTIHGYIPGPITHTTKRVYLRKLHQLKRYPAVVDVQDRALVKKVYSVELEKTLKDISTWSQDLTVYKTLEDEVTKQFSNPDPTRKWREGVAKSSFTYLLLDPRTTKNLPARADGLTKKEIWDTFLNAIFYVGKGKRSRPYQHLYDAVNLWNGKKSESNGAKFEYKNGKSVSRGGKFKSQIANIDPNGGKFESDRGKFEYNCGEKLQNILDIWRSGNGVICLHVFLNVIPVEAYTREAAMISALKLENLTNLKAGEYYGIANTWTQRHKKMLGVYLLYRAMGVFLNEGERQLCPCDIE